MRGTVTRSAARQKQASPNRTLRPPWVLALAGPREKMIAAAQSYACGAKRAGAKGSMSRPTPMSGVEDWPSARSATSAPE